MDSTNLARRLYITYKSRINAAERLKKTNGFIQGLNIYYSLFLTALSIYSVTSGTQKLALVITICSVIVTVTIVFLAAQNYGERSKSLKNNYVAIFKLYNIINDDVDANALQIIVDEYNKLIDSSENHAEYDYFKARISMSDEKNNLTFRQKSVFYLFYYGSILLKSLLIVLPFLLQYIVSILEWLIKV